MSIELPVPGHSLDDRARRVAGSLAELGIQHLELRTGLGEARNLAARLTDLPGILMALGAEDRLACVSLGVTFRREGEHLYWSATHSAGAELARALGA